MGGSHGLWDAAGRVDGMTYHPAPPPRREPPRHASVTVYGENLAALERSAQAAFDELFEEGTWTFTAVRIEPEIYGTTGVGYPGANPSVWRGEYEATA